VDETALKKQHGEKIEAPKEHEPAKVIDLMEALRRSVECGGGTEHRKRSKTAHHRTKKQGRARHKKAS
jgi:non-homologous end joining protein Ku